MTVPPVVEATAGVASTGEIFDAPDFLRALPPHISLEVVRLPTPLLTCIP
ncbi:hypothetical protein [Actinoplanes sp. NPDC049118]